LRGSKTLKKVTGAAMESGSYWGCHNGSERKA
jgi:hypothetical protein